MGEPPDISGPLVSWTLCGERDVHLLGDALRSVAPVVDRALVIGGPYMKIARKVSSS